jgi:hypothetical protein
VNEDARLPCRLARVEADRKVSQLLAGKNIVEKIVLPGRLVNLVVRD